MKCWRKIIISVVILACCSPLAINGWVMMRSTPYILTMEEASGLEADCAIVLGARVYPDGRLSAMLEDRVVRGIALYEKGAVKKLLMSGDHGQASYDEVNAMKDYAVAEGIDTEDVFLDHAGFSTYESMYRAKEIFLSKKVIIVSQAYHLPRSVYIARTLGLEAYGVAAEQIEYPNQMKRDVREFLARVKDFFKVHLRVKPTYLGDTIPVSGSGHLTHDKD
ncbi:MAG: SanA/YdcF family protein [Cellulosilyticaceae bacterium]